MPGTLLRDQIHDSPRRRVYESGGGGGSAVMLQAGSVRCLYKLTVSLLSVHMSTSGPPEAHL